MQQYALKSILFHYKNQQIKKFKLICTHLFFLNPTFISLLLKFQQNKKNKL